MVLREARSLVGGSFTWKQERTVSGKVVLSKAMSLVRGSLTWNLEGTVSGKAVFKRLLVWVSPQGFLCTLLPNSSTFARSWHLSSVLEQLLQSFTLNPLPRLVYDCVSLSVSVCRNTVSICRVWKFKSAAVQLAVYSVLFFFFLSVASPRVQQLAQHRDPHRQWTGDRWVVSLLA